MKQHKILELATTMKSSAIVCNNVHLIGASLSIEVEHKDVKGYRYQTPPTKC